MRSVWTRRPSRVPSNPRILCSVKTVCLSFSASAFQKVVRFSVTTLGVLEMVPAEVPTSQRGRPKPDVERRSRHPLRCCCGTGNQPAGISLPPSCPLRHLHFKPSLQMGQEPNHHSSRQIPALRKGTFGFQRPRFAFKDRKSFCCGIPCNGERYSNS